MDPQYIVEGVEAACRDHLVDGLGQWVARSVELAVSYLSELDSRRL